MVEDKIIIAKGFINAKRDCKHEAIRILKSGFYEYSLCQQCGKNLGEVNDKGVQSTNS